MWNYLYWLIGISLGFSCLERFCPERCSQRFVRPQIFNDLFFLIFNGHLYALWFASLVAVFAAGTRDALNAAHILPSTGLLTGASFLAQFFAYLLVSDFLQWNVHRLLHKVPLLWQFHKFHHSIQTMDWAGNFRFHWAENIVYRSILYIPLLWLGGDSSPLFAAAVFGTAWGHFNHSNLNVGLGPLGFVFNSPRMHLWHHDSSSEGGVSKNYGIVLSLWDFLFGTAYWPKDHSPERLGYPGDSEMPTDLPRQLLFPLSRR